VVNPGAVVQANFQTEGRGRLGRKWESQPENGLLFSMLLYPPLPESHLPLIGLLASLALVDALSALIGRSQSLELRWPNDILFDGKKLCGILCESAQSLSGQKLIAAGIGINVNQSEEDFPGDFRTPATSLYLITGKRNNPSKLLPSMLHSLGIYLDRLAQDGWEWVAKEWIDRAELIDKTVDVADGKARFSGKVANILPDGALVIIQGGGAMRTIRSGEWIV